MPRNVTSFRLVLLDRWTDIPAGLLTQTQSCSYRMTGMRVFLCCVPGGAFFFFLPDDDGDVGDGNDSASADERSVS
eukprot:CAMPEP_0119027626 /NCGR_PEP_ID=MMETSP1176-20130426/37426_1 /TAXON_ID=265551 /ORGANISM="Synedropsis recta cf, Strain CCMP1620" /LENGTH=75 /DNA_ID=CAMNT_0006983583 /DNA_START=411 /DNA_END=635 /DNA_ORIENTATION=-